MSNYRKTPPSNEEMRAWLEARGSIYYETQGSDNRFASRIIIKFRSLQGGEKCIPYDSIPGAYRRLHGVIG